MTLIFSILACLGLTFILKYGTILNVPRDWLREKSRFLDELFKCSLCLGFWSGIVIGLICFALKILDNIAVLMPLVSAGCCWIGDNLNNVIQSIEIKLDKENDS